MAKTIPAANMAEAFLAVRQFLWDGIGKYYDATAAGKTSTICGAAGLAHEQRAISKAQMLEIQDTVQKRLGEYATVTQYLMKQTNIYDRRLFQEFRDAWLCQLAREAGNTEVEVFNIAPWPTGRKD